MPDTSVPRAPGHCQVRFMYRGIHDESRSASTLTRRCPWLAFTALIAGCSGATPAATSESGTPTTSRLRQSSQQNHHRPPPPRVRALLPRSPPTPTWPSLLPTTLAGEPVTAQSFERRASGRRPARQPCADRPGRARAEPRNAVDRHPGCGGVRAGSRTVQLAARRRGATRPRRRALTRSSRRSR